MRFFEGRGWAISADEQKELAYLFVESLELITQLSGVNLCCGDNRDL